MDMNAALVIGEVNVVEEEIVLEQLEAVTPLLPFTTVDGAVLDEQVWSDLLDRASGRPDDVKLRRLKLATEAYREHKAIHADELTDQQFQGYMSWPNFRDQFLVDRELNYRLVDEQEADVIFETAAETALAVIEGDNAESTEGETSGGTIGVIVANPLTGEPIAVATGTVTDTTEGGSGTTAEAPKKKRGRPAGSGKAKAAAKKAAKVTKVKTVKAKKKAAAKKASGGESKADQAREIIKTWAAKGWERKDIIAKLMDRLSFTKATASTYYQNYK